MSPTATAPSVKTSDGATVSDEEFEQLLDELATGPELPRLPVDFARTDIYADQD